MGRVHFPDHAVGGHVGELTHFEPIFPTLRGAFRTFGDRTERQPVADPRNFFRLISDPDRDGLTNELVVPVGSMSLNGKLTDCLCDISQGSRVYLLVIKILF